MAAITTTTTTTPGTINLPAPRRKTRVKEVPGAAVPIPSALRHPPCTHYEATYSQGYITVRDPRQAAALWHNGYYGHGLEKGGGGGGTGGGQRGRKQWRLVEADGLKDGKWFKETQEKERQRREFKGGGVEESGGGGEETEGREREFIEANRRKEEMRMNWEEEDEEEEEDDEDEDYKGEGKENTITGLNYDDRAEEEKDRMEEETHDTAEEERENTDRRENTTSTQPAKQHTDDRNRDDARPKRDEEDATEPWRTVLVLSAEQEANPDHHDPYAHLTLLPEEALFLSYALGCLVLMHEDPPPAWGKHGRKRALQEEPASHEMTLDEMWRVFVRDDAAFPVKYAAFHHFRTQGWVVKAGLKYGVDYVLYPVGPPFYHSQYAVKIHSLWADTLTLDHSLPGHEMTWTTMATTERLTNHINKTPVMCFVLRPRAITDQRLALIECLKELKVQTVALGRWNPSDGSG